MSKDIFISYKDEILGSSFAARICADFERAGYSVYFNPNEKCAGAFPVRIKNAIESCKDFILILSQACLDQLKKHPKIDWVREEVLLARSLHKNIIPLLLPGVSMPSDKEEMPEDLRFLPDIDAIPMPDQYDVSPLQVLFSWLNARPLAEVSFSDDYNNSSERNIDDDFNRALNSNDPESRFELANLYYYGLIGDESGCERDFRKAYQVSRRLAEDSSRRLPESPHSNYLISLMRFSAGAMSIIGEMYYHGVVPRKEQSYHESFICHEQAKRMSGFSRREAAYLKSRGCGSEYDFASIVEYYEEAIEQGDSLAIMGLAKYYLKTGKFKEAEALFKRSSHSMPEAYFQLGMLYREGVLCDPPQPDYYRAAYYFRHAIDSGYNNPELYHQLGRLYFTPVGDFEKNFRLAEEFFQKAADAGIASAQYKLGLMFEYGYVHKDIEKAIYYHSLAAAQGNAFSAYHLSLLYQHPSQRNFRLAFNNAKIAAENGIMEGEFIFAILLFYGRGCVADEEKAYKYFEKAFDHGMLAAQIYLDKYNKT